MADEANVRILNVDDFEPARYHRTRVLKQAGFTVLEAKTGREALERVKQEKPKVILLDLNLPDIDGFDVCREIKADPQMSGVLVLHMSASLTEAKDRARALESGADAFLVEPADPVELVALVRALLRIARAEEALRVSSQLMHAVIEGATDGIYVKDREGRYLMANAAGAGFAGLSVQDLLGKSDRELLSPEVAAKYQTEDQEIVESGHRCGFEETVELAGRTRVFHTVKVPYCDEQGNRIGVIGISREITERKQKEEALRESEERFRAVWDNATDAMALSDPEGIVIAANPAYYQLYGYAPEQVIGHSFAIIFPEEQRNWAVAEYRRLFDQETLAPRVESLVRRKDGSERTVEAHYSFLTRNGQRMAMLSVVQDISERKQAEKEREQLLAREQAAHAKAEAAVRLRDQFFRVASHELKNPLAVVIGYTDLLRQRVAQHGQFGPDEERMARTVSEQTQRLDKIITALLDVTQIETGRLSLEMVPFDLIALTRRVVEGSQLGLHKHHLELAVPDAVLWVDGDELRIEQVLQNLIQNAIKYSPKGGLVQVAIGHTDTMVSVAVSDQGIGIPAEALPQLFERYYRAGNAEALHIGGLGMGLFLVKGLVELHGGRIEVETQEGRGSTFRVWLPRWRAGK